MVGRSSATLTIVALGLLAILTVGCAGADDEGVRALTTRLADTGSEVRVVERFEPQVQQLGDDGWSLCIDGQLIRAYAFGDSTEALAAARRLDANAPLQMGNASIAWAGTARFWHFRRVVVAYLGPVEAMEQRLTAALGPPVSEGGGRAADPTTFTC